MKKLYFKAFLLFALSIFTLSCTTDPIEPDDPDQPENPNTPASYFKYDGKYFELTKGFLKIFSSSSNLYSLYLTGPNINYDTDMGALSGTDQTVLINFILSENAISLPVADFPYCTGAVEENKYTSMRFDTNYTFTASGVLTGIENRRDTVHVTKTGNNYNILYKGYDGLLKSFEIKYNGTINFIN